MSTEIIGRVPSVSVQKHTGKNWDQWIRLLNQAGAVNLSHKEIVSFLVKKYKLGPWWSQGVTTGYEIAIGRKVMGQNSKGELSLTSSRTFPVNEKKMWKILLSSQGLDCWLKPISKFQLKPGFTFEAENGVYGEVRTFKEFKRARIKWQDTDWPKPSIVQIMLVPRKNNKCILVFQHEKLMNGRIKNSIRDYWKKALVDLLGLTSSL